MTAGAFLDVVGFTAASSGTVDFVVSAAVLGYQTPATAGAVNATVYSYRAQSADLTQWEDGFGAYTVGSVTLARTTIVFSSTGAKVSFTAPPNVFITALTADLSNAALLTSGTLPVARINGGTVNQTVQGDGSFVLQSRKLLNTLTASSSATLSDTASLTATFSEYEIAFEKILPATSAVNFELQVHSGGTFPATAYLTTGFGNTAGGTLITTVPTTFVPLSLASNGVGNTGTSGLNGWIRVFNPSASALAHWTGQTSYLNSSGSITTGIFGGYWNSVAVVDGFQVLFSSGNIASGTVKVYGLN
jgi:hypothetical protein